MSTTRKPFSIYTGQNAQIRIATLSKGLIRPNLVEAFDYTPTLGSQRVSEFDNPVDALTFQTFDGGNGKFGYQHNNQAQIEALLSNNDPTAAVQLVNPSSFTPFTPFMNLKGLDGLIKGFVLVTTPILTSIFNRRPSVFLRKVSLKHAQIAAVDPFATE